MDETFLQTHFCFFFSLNLGNSDRVQLFNRWHFLPSPSPRCHGTYKIFNVVIWDFLFSLPFHKTMPNRSFFNMRPETEIKCPDKIIWSLLIIIIVWVRIKPAGPHRGDILRPFLLNFNLAFFFFFLYSPLCQICSGRVLLFFFE